jgi:hypothetical protein
MPTRLVALALLLAAALAGATTPGKHTIAYAWTDPTCDQSITCSYRVYRGTASGVCSGNPTPYASGIVGASYTDATPIIGINVVAVSAFDPATGGESACSAEVQSTVSPITTKVPQNPTATVN